MEFDQFENEHKSSDVLFKELVNKALENKHSKFEFIRNYDMWKAAKMYRSGVKRVYKMFKNIEADLIVRYGQVINAGKEDLELVMAIRQFAHCVQYYKEEHAIAKDMLSEFGCYMRSGHILQTLLGGLRPEYECVDYRKLPLKLF